MGYPPKALFSSSSSSSSSSIPHHDDKGFLGGFLGGIFLGGGVVFGLIFLWVFGRKLIHRFILYRNYENINVRYFRTQNLDATEPADPLIPSCPYPYSPLAVPRQRGRNERGDGRVVLEMGGDRESLV